MLGVGCCCYLYRSVNRKLYVVDAQPRANALANGAKGGGSESSSNYPKSEVLFLGIQNIHTMRDSLSRLRDYVDAHGSISSNGSSSAVPLVGDWRNRGPNWGGGSLNSVTQFSSMLVEWLNNIQNILIGASGIAAQIAQEYIITKTISELRSARGARFEQLLEIVMSLPPLQELQRESKQGLGSRSSVISVYLQHVIDYRKFHNTLSRSFADCSHNDELADHVSKAKAA